MKAAAILLVYGTVLLWWPIGELRDAWTRRRWKKRGLGAKRLAKLHPSVVQGIRSVRGKEGFKDNYDRRQLASHLVLGPTATRRWSMIAFVVMAAAAGSIIFTVTARRMPMDDIVQFWIPVVAAMLGVLGAEWLALNLVPKLVPLIRGRVGAAAEALVEATALGGDEPPLSQRWRQSRRALARARVESSFEAAGIPIAIPRVERYNYTNDEEWSLFLRSSANGLASAYSGDYQGHSTGRRVFRFSTIMAVLVALVSTLPSLVDLARAVVL